MSEYSMDEVRMIAKPRQADGKLKKALNMSYLRTGNEVEGAIAAPREDVQQATTYRTALGSAALNQVRFRSHQSI